MTHMHAALTPRQERFVEEYLVDSNATQAAIRAGYSKKTAYSQGHRLLKNVEVAEAIMEGRASVAEEASVSAAWVVQEAKRDHEQAVLDGRLRDSCRALDIIGRAIGAFDHKRRIARYVTYNFVDHLPLSPALTRPLDFELVPLARGVSPRRKRRHRAARAAGPLAGQTARSSTVSGWVECSITTTGRSHDGAIKFFDPTASSCSRVRFG